MRVHLLLSALLWVALSDRPGAAEPIPRPADVMPARTLAYLEIRQPGRIVQEITRLFEGSVLSDAPHSLAELQAKYPRPSYRGGPEEVALAGAFLAPEIGRELGRIPGAAVSITGIDKENKDMPEFVAVILPGDSNIAPLMMRIFLTTFAQGYSSFDGKTRIDMRSRFTPVGEVEGVWLYRLKQRRTVVTSTDRGTAAAQEEVREEGPVLAMMPEALLIGSPSQVQEVIGRIKGKVKEPSLATTEAYREASQELGERAGIFCLADVKAVLATVEQLPLGPSERKALAAIKQLVNPAVVASVSSATSLENGNLRLRWQARLDPLEKSRALEVLPSTGLTSALLHFVPQDATAVAAVSNADGGQRLQNLLHLADDIFRAAGERGRPPSEEFARLEEMLQLKIGKELVAKIDAAALAVAGPNWFRGLVPPVVLIVQATDEEAAKGLAAETLPKILGLVTRQPTLRPQEREVQGQTLYVAPLFGLFGICYGREGSTLVLGGYPELVADVLSSGPKKKGLLADEKLGTSLKKPEETLLFVAIKPLTLANAVVPTALPLLPRTGPADKPGGAGAQDPGAKVLSGLPQLAKDEKPIVLTLTRRGDLLAAELNVGGLTQVVPKATDLAVEIFYQLQAQEARRGAATSPALQPPGVR